MLRSFNVTRRRSSTDVGLYQRPQRADLPEAQQPPSDLTLSPISCSIVAYGDWTAFVSSPVGGGGCHFASDVEEGQNISIAGLTREPSTASSMSMISNRIGLTCVIINGK